MDNNIKLLLKKDKLMFSQMGGYMILYSVVAVAITGMTGWFSSFAVILSTVFFSTATSSALVHEEEHSKCGLMMFTLPVKTKDFLKARYIFFAAYPLKMVFFSSLIGMLANILIIPEARNFELIILYSSGFVSAIAVAFFFPALFLPLYYALGASKSRLVFALATFFAVVMINPILRFSPMGKQSTSFTIPLILMVLSMFAYYISYRISLKLIRTTRVF